MKIKHLALAVALGLGVSQLAYADTTSSVRGNVVTEAGQVAANARVEILHVPTGTRTTTTTNDAGAFSSTGLRVGGPYVITIRGDQGSVTYDEVYLTLGDGLRLNAQLASSVERIAVTGSSIMVVNNTGSSSFFGARDIENAPTFNRDLKDIIRNNPLVNINAADGTISVAGTNPRFNSISVDGIGINDDFGLNFTGYPTTRSPISLDAIEQVIVDTSPFHAKDSGFQGAKINAVTKSGTNELSGSFFFERQNDSWAGEYKHNNSRDSLDFDEKTWGATLGGALVQDKLFFFASYERYSSPQASGWGPSGVSGVANATNVTAEELQTVAQIANDIYGVQVGDWAVSPTTKDEKILLKLDWNINDDHRAALTYQRSDGNKIQNTTDDPRTLKLSSHWYDRSETMDSYAFKLFSDWTHDFSTEIYATYQDRSTGQNSLSTLPQVFVDIEGDSNRRIAFGSDHSRHANELSNKTLILGIDGTYLLDDHKLSFGYQFKETEANNLFVQYARGSYRFTSIEDFENRLATELRYQNAPSLDPRDAAVSFKRGEHAFYIQDEYAITPDVLLSFGLRYERLTTSDVPAFNESFLTQTGFDNRENLNGLDIWLPRFGFKWDAATDLVVRGGIGRFSGGQPSVWAGNAYGNNGINKVDSGNVGATFGPTELRDSLVGVDITTVPVSFEDYVRSGADSPINLNDPNFKIPSDWRFQLATDYRFSLGDYLQNVLWTTEYSYVKPENSVFWKNVTIGDVFYETTDGRKLYQDAGLPALMMTNADSEGRSHIITTSLFKRWESGLSVNTSYTYQDITSATVGSASTAHGNFGNNIAINRNEALVGTSPYETRHRFVLNISYETEIFSGYTTTFNSFFERKSGKALTYLANISGSANREAFGYSDGGGGVLAYIPSPDDAQYVFESEARKQEFYDIVASMGLNGYIGGYVPKGGFNSPWVTTWDVGVRQQVPGFHKDHKGELYFTISNFLNLLDSSKGHVRDTEFGTISLYQVRDVNQDTGEITIRGFQPREGSNWERFNENESTWRLKLGVRYRF
ncbi:TonB-dependent receptor [Alkalimonas sp. NCh-2]|uniref:TonB-dependent receptor n=1 Tax=Alkalimonas sp. NCh-2 TaxID=3144846 RepID=UPI0031F6382C